MAMEVDSEPVSSEVNQIINELTNNEKVCFKSQQLGETDFTLAEKNQIATELFTNSKLNFLTRFGKYLSVQSLRYFEPFSTENVELSVVLNNVNRAKQKESICVKNRRFQALNELIEEDSYFSEIEMMKRNPLLYQQLIGQYLTDEEKMERDRIEATDDTTLVKVLLEGIERDDAKAKHREQEDSEEAQEDSNSNEMEDDSDSDGDLKPTYSQWGEFSDETKVIKFKKAKSNEITPEEQDLLREEFINSMYESFLSGKDEDFDYDSVDNNDKFDNEKMNDYDEEDKYFDAEEPETVRPDDDKTAREESSEDELDIFMSALNQNPAVSELSKDIAKL